MKQYTITLSITISLLLSPYFNYYHLINQANYAASKGKNIEADSLFQEAVKTVEVPFAKDYEFAIENALVLEDYKKIFFYLKKGMQLGLSKEKILRKQWFSKIKNREEWLLLEKEYPKIWEAYEEQFDGELRQTVLKIYHRDQDFRLNGGENFDEENLEELKQLIDENDYLGFHQIGQDIDLHIIFHHFLPEVNQRFFYKKLKKAVSQGNITPYQYAAIIDYDRLKSNLPTIYGTYFKTVDGFRYLETVENFELIDERRRDIGLEPIDQFMEKFNIIYDPSVVGY